MRAWVGVVMLAVVAVVAVSLGFQTVRAAEHPGRAEHPGSPQKAEETAVFQCPMHPEVMATWAGKCPKCGMKLTEAEKGPGMPMHMMCMGGMQKEGDAESMGGMMMRCRMMMGAQLQKTDPVGLFALEEELELSEEQVNELQQIVETARRQARRILNQQQKQKLEAMPDQPHSMMQMHQRMQQMMKGQMKEHPGPKEEQEHGGHGMHHGGMHGPGRTQGGFERD